MRPALPAVETRELVIDMGDFKSKAYTRLMFDNKRPAKVVYKEMMALLGQANENGWRDVLEDTDIPASADGLSQLWVRRNVYNPGKDLQKFKGAHLIVLGGNDFVVPVRENVVRYQEFYGEVGKTNYRIAVLPGAGHGLEHGTIKRVLDRRGL